MHQLSRSLNILLLGLLAGLCLAPVVSLAQDQPLKFVIQPNYPPEQSRAIHQQLISYLENAIEREIEVVTPRDFHQYWTEMRSGQDFDVTLEDAHMVDYRMRNFGYTPLMHAAKALSFHLLSADPGVTVPDDLIGLRISSMSSPSLGYQVLTEWYDNPMAQPLIMSSARSWQESVDMVFAMESDATIAPFWLAERYPNLASIAASREFPGLTLGVSSALDASIRESIHRAMIELNDHEDAFSILSELEIERFVTASADEYESLSEFLNSLYH